MFGYRSPRHHFPHIAQGSFLGATFSRRDVWGTRPFVLIGQYMIWGRFVYARWKKRRTFYALTNRRALIVVNGWRGRTTSSAYFDGLSGHRQAIAVGWDWVNRVRRAGDGRMASRKEQSAASADVR